MTILAFTQIVVVVGLTFFAGCAQSSDGGVDGRAKSPVVDSTKFLLTDEPQGAMGVTELRKQAEDEDDVVLIGRIGGAVDPWVEGRSAFAVVDATIELCEGGVYACCKDKVCDATALVKIVDAHGHLFKTDARELLNVKENQLVVVPGIAKRDDAGNLTILASGVYIRR